MYRLIYAADKKNYKIIKKKNIYSDKYKNIAVNDFHILSPICRMLNAGIPKILLKRINECKNDGDIPTKMIKKNSSLNLSRETNALLTDVRDKIRQPAIVIEQLNETNLLSPSLTKDPNKSLNIEECLLMMDSDCGLEMRTVPNKNISTIQASTNANKSSSTEQNDETPDHSPEIYSGLNNNDFTMKRTLVLDDKKSFSDIKKTMGDSKNIIDESVDELNLCTQSDQNKTTIRNKVYKAAINCHVITEETSILPSFEINKNKEDVVLHELNKEKFDDLPNRVIPINIVQNSGESSVSQNDQDLGFNLAELDIIIVNDNFDPQSVGLASEGFELSSEVLPSVITSRSIDNVNKRSGFDESVKLSGNHCEFNSTNGSHAVSSDEENNFDRVFQEECSNWQAENDHNCTQFISPEDDLIEKVIMPNIDEANMDDDNDLSTYESTYEISDHLENILSSQLESETVEIIRDHTDNNDSNYNVSIPNLRPRPPENLNENSDFSLEYNSISRDTTDIDFDPNKVSHSSTVTEDFSVDVQTRKVDNGGLTAKNSPKNMSSCTLNMEKTIIGNSTSILIPLPSKGSCDSSKLKVESSITTDESGNTTFHPRWKKKYFCIYCHKLVVKLPRHIESVHKDIAEAQQLKNTPKGTEERKKIVEIFRDNGRTLHNTNPEYNTGKLLVSRRPKSESKSAVDYTTCAKCLKPIVKSNSYKHFAACIGAKTNGAHSYKFLGRYVEGRVHATASDTLSLVIFPVFQEDAIVRLIRYDWLLVLYGNKLCIKHPPHYQHNLIRAKLRLVGRLLFAAKEINPQIEDLASIFAPEYIDTIVKAIESVAKINRMQNDCGAPSSALNLVTYLKHIRKLYESELAKKNDKEGLERVMRFKKVYKNEMPDSINKIAMEAQSKIKRQKVVILPMTDDIIKLVNYLKAERKRCFAVLEQKFNLLEWLHGLKLLAAYILVFNRRRVGDIQNILLSDLKKIECIDKKADREEFNLLDDAGKAIAKKFFRVAIRGKKNRTVAVIMGGDVIKNINIIIRHRLSASVPLNNEYLFGLPNNIDDRIRVVNICKEMRIFSGKCGAAQPKLLRGTGLRKHVATKCIELELNDKALGDVINHMGHSEKIHKDFYQQPLKSKTIVQVAKVLEAVQGPVDNDDEENGVDELSDYIEITNHVRDNKTKQYSDDLSEPSYSHDMENSDVRQNSSLETGPIDIEHNVSDGDQFSNENIFSPEEDDSDDDYKSTRENVMKKGPKTGKIQRKRWTQTELNIIIPAFQHHLQAGTLPSTTEIDALRDKYPCFQDRSRLSMKTWVSNKLKSMKSAKGPKIVSNKEVQMNVSQYLKDGGKSPLRKIKYQDSITLNK